MNLRAIAQAALDAVCPAPAEQSAGRVPLTDLQKHDKIHHPHGFDPAHDTCKYRDRLAKHDQSDLIPSPDGRTAFGHASPDAEYAAVVAKYKGTPQWMKAPNGKPTNLTEKQWVQVRTPSFKKWFGDWESNAKIPVSDMATAKSFLKGLMEQNAVMITADGAKLKFVSQSAKAYSKAAEIESDNKAAHWTALANLESILPRAQFMYDESPRNGSRDIDAYVKFGAVFRMGDDQYLAKITSKRYPGRDEHNFYNIESISVKKIDARGIHEAIAKRQPLDTGDTNRIAKILAESKGGSKIVDSNGEPMVCWHGGPDNTFPKFDKRKIHPKDGLRTFFFSPPERRDSMAGFYGKGKERPFFLNIRHPLTLDPDTHPKNLKGVDGIIRVYADNDVWKPRYFNYRTDKEETERIKKGDILEIQVFEPNQIKLAVGNSGEFNPKKVSVMDSKIDLKRIASLAIAEDSAQDTALEVALEYLQDEPIPPPRCRYPKVPMPSDVRGTSAATSALDAAPSPEGQTGFAQPLTDLQRHDRRFHPKGYKKGDACKYRETLAKTDNVDDLAAAERDEHKAKYGNLSVKKRDEYFRLMSKKHPEIDAEAALAEIGKITDPKVQKDAFAWLMRGAVRLPEDLYKVEQARELAGKAKKDPLSYDTPQACINELLGQGHKVSLKPITVDELKKDPLFSDYRKFPYGVETFEVEDSKEGQKRMREVLDSHWGEDANPWCLLARSGLAETRERTEEYKKWLSRHWHLEGDLEATSDRYERETGQKAYRFVRLSDEQRMSDAWGYWNHYNALPKRVAFKDGKLLAFMATHALDEDEAFDDAAYGTGGKLPDMYPDEYKEYEDWEETEEGQNEGANFYQWLQVNYPELADEDGLREHTAEEWWDRQDSPHQGIPVGNVPVQSDPYGRWADIEVRNGKPEPMTAGNYTIENGKPVYPVYWHKGERNKDGYVEWFDNGQKRQETKGGMNQTWFEDGAPQLIEASGLSATFSRNGDLLYVTNHPSSDHTERMPLTVSMTKDGRLLEISYHEDGPDGNRVYTDIQYDSKGNPLPTNSMLKAGQKPKEVERKLLPKVNELIAKAKGEYAARRAQKPSPRGAAAASSPPRAPAFDEAKFKLFLAGAEN